MAWNDWDDLLFAAFMGCVGIAFLLVSGDLEWTEIAIIGSLSVSVFWLTYDLRRHRKALFEYQAED